MAEKQIPTLAAPPAQVDPDAQSPLRLVVYGDPGVGKTSLALSFPRPLIINTDEGLEGDALYMLQQQKGYEHSPAGHKDLEALYYFIRDNSEHFDTIVIDSLDELVRLLLDEIVDDGKGKDSKHKSVTDYVPEQAEYLANQRQMHTFLSQIRALRKNIVVTSAVRSADLDGKRTVDVAPGMQRIVKRWASVMGELVIASPAEGAPPARILTTDPGSARSQNKTRYAALLPYVVEPTYTEITGRIQAAREAHGQSVEG